MVSYQSKTFSENYDVLAGNWEYDKEESVYSGIPQIIHVTFPYRPRRNSAPTGCCKRYATRWSTDEALRRVDAHQFFKENGEICPANWYSRGKVLLGT